MTITTKATPKAIKATPKAPTLMCFISESTQVAVSSKPFDYAMAVKAGVFNASVEENLLSLVFTKAELPTWKDLKESVKAINKTLPVSERLAIPDSKAQGFSAINQAMANAKTIRDIESEFSEFNALEAWNAKAKEAKRNRLPTISAILKLARAVKNGAKPEATPMEVFEKGLKLAYKGALEFKNSKQAQARLNKLLAMAQADGITLETETETETDE